MLLRIHEAAERLRVSPHTVRKYISAGRLPATQYCPKGMLWIAESDVESLKRGGRSQ